MSASVTHLNTPQPAEPLKNAVFLEAMLQITDAVLRLTAQGHKVLSTHTQRGALPCIQLVASPELVALVNDDRAAYYHYGIDPDGRRFRHGQFQISGVRCIWVEYVDH